MESTSIFGAPQVGGTELFIILVIILLYFGASSFGASETPSAVLVDEVGNIASELAVAAPAVLALAGNRQAEV